MEALFDANARLINLFDQDVEISVRPKRTDEARISVSVAHVLWSEPITQLLRTVPGGASNG